MMAQYLAAKADHQDALVFYRMGDFYELFFDDAIKGARALDIALTRRGAHQGEDVPMCGVPVHAVDAYLQRLIRKGFKVAICEQVEDAALRKKGAKGPLRREVVRVVTPGTLTEEALLDAGRANYLVALARAEGGLGLAWCEVSTGEMSAAPVASVDLGAELARLDPGELVLPDTLLQEPALFEAFAPWKARLTPQPAARFSSREGEQRLKETYQVAALDGFGAFGRAELAALGGLIEYVKLTQVGRLPRLRPPVRRTAFDVMAIDAATRRNLELAQTLAGERKGSLLDAIDRTVTGAGARLLAARLSAPLTAPAAIDRRLDLVAYLVERETLRAALRQELGAAPEIERALSRLSLGRGGPRDLAAIRAGLAAAGALRRRLEAEADPPTELKAAIGDLGFHGELVERLGRALKPDLPLLARDGGFVAPGYRPELDRQLALRDESRRLIAGLESKYRGETAVSGLRIKHNNVIGYFIEVTPTHADKLGARPELFIHRQSLAGAARFTTTELAEFETAIARAAERALALELALFEELAGEVLARGDDVLRTAAALAALDVGAGLATLAVEGRWCRPRVDDSLGFEIKGGRHPVVERALRETGAAAFVANDGDLAPERRLWLVTGPNMAGKSTFLRQNALIAILAQIGSFVPAEAAAIGAIDRLFSRVGAADDLARGRSTFMVEMIETAAILNQAGPRALVILDEIGRGTATFDGLSIAWATLEHLHDVNRCRALFATHYHELVALADRLPALRPMTIKVKEFKGEVVFLHEVAPGAADRSYGIQVAKLAGLPAAVIARAQSVLRQLESQRPGAGTINSLPLFAAQAETVPAEPSAAEAALAAIEPDQLTPRTALDLIYRLKGMVGSRS
ncbi:MAG: DNA mismatch repair protein MutS [Alphaproteobacteria bacterium]|nr:DNA mismatch repair protein MutS [Alphaproteobacteria bacterium]